MVCGGRARRNEPRAPLESSSRHGQVYRWTDDQGVMHMTDRWEVVPEQYRGHCGDCGGKAERKI